MSCFVAIPSRGDTRSAAFGLLGKPWNLKQELIHVGPNGSVTRLPRGFENVETSGLVIVGRPILSMQYDDARKFFSSSEVQGIFFHPGRTNTPGNKQIADYLNTLNIKLADSMRSKTVAFTHSGDQNFQVGFLQLVWSWLATNEDGQTQIHGLDWNSLSDAYQKLRQKSVRDPLVKLGVIAQGCIEQKITQEVRGEFSRKLLNFLEIEGDWIAHDPFFKEAIAQLYITGDPDGSLNEESVMCLLDCIKSHFSDGLTNGDGSASS